MSLTVVSLGYATVSLSFRDPLIIERSCYSKPLKATSTEVSPQELESFVREAIHQRFDSNATIAGEFISAEELASRQQEQQEIAQRSMSQRVLVNSIEVKGNVVTANTDRLISVAQVRSAFPYPLTLTLSSGTRSETNPYGLTVLKFSEIKRETH
jgi:hypothetical protein